jgi:hypothetical protein
MKFIIIAIVKKSIPVGISLPKDLISKIDEERGEIPRSRYLFRRLQTIFMNENNSSLILVGKDFRIRSIVVVSLQSSGPRAHKSELL